MYNKPWLSYEQQLDRLIQNGLIINNRSEALSYLERIGYYRLSGYWYPFRKRSELCCVYNPAIKKPNKRQKRTTKLVFDNFSEGFSFQDAVNLYIFDKKLRVLTLDALERIEIALRVDISHTLGRHSPFAYLEPDHFKDLFSKQVDAKTGVIPQHAWLQNHANLISRSKEDFIQHTKEKYGLPVPIWVACEIWDFGTLSRLFKGMLPDQQTLIANKYRVTKGETLESWLRCLNYLRNVCAHHSRLWNRNMIEQPKHDGLIDIYGIENTLSTHILARPFLQLCLIKHLLTTINPNSTWWERLKTLLDEFPEPSGQGITLEAMGIIEGYRDW
ncbi:Abi family protein [Marinomonas aquiplantarum]|uniref:Abortive infection bacteriophage resistance protein n=1 Tax=Marinomonas aquiplantarum TaxID=491951 RepID=A0A366D7Z8_9GAMM|nr:Abi family protein [Marinomonas aquiplantarum]RBO86116.1 abortive infection bacteriophage resistance protein [Marinomonas aquiplantarum]